MLKCLHFFPLPDYYLMISESRYSWCVVSVFGKSLCSWVSARGKMRICHHLQLGLRTKISKKPEVSSLIDLILAMTVLSSNMTLTLRKSRVHCCGVMQFWACSSLMSATFPAEAGCETWVQIWKQRFTSSCGSRRLAARDCWRHLWQVMHWDNDCWLQ